MPLPLTWADLGSASDSAIVVNSDGSAQIAEKYLTDPLLFAIDFCRYAYKAQEDKNNAYPEEMPLNDFDPPSFGTPAYDSVSAKFTMAAVCSFRRQMSLLLV